MPKPVKQRRRATAKPVPAKAPPGRAASHGPRRKVTDWWPVLGPAILVVMTLACYWVPMTSTETSILWDAADYHRAVQDYMSQELHAGRIPFWTPYPWAGYPFLADPQVGAWYPPNWPFFWSGISSRVLFMEHCLHAMWACFGAYFLAWRLVRHRQSAVLAGLCYGFSGLFVANSSHTGVLQTISWTPWLLLLLDRALASNTLRNTILGGMAAGMMILAGHFQMSLYSFVALGLYAAARVLQEPRRWMQIFAPALAIPIVGTLISGIGTLPGLELAAASVRSTLNAVAHHEGAMPLPALITLVYPNFYGGILWGQYHGPFEMTQYYYYSGILLLPLALLGLRNRAFRWMALLFTIPPIWYAVGPFGGLYLLIARLPGFSSVRAPVNMWLVPALGLPILAAAGLAALAEIKPVKWLPAAVLAFFCADLFYVQSAGNQLAYSRTSYAQLYGIKEARFQQVLSSHLPPLTRFDAPDIMVALGPLSEFLTTRTEVTYGYSPLKPSRYADYVEAIKSNPRLRDGLNVIVWFDPQTGGLRPNPTALPRVNFPQMLVPVRSSEESKQRLLTLDQAHEALVPAQMAVSAQDGNGLAQVREFTPGHYRIHYRCASPSVLRVGSSYYNGWTASVNGKPVEIFPVDHALTGVLAPAGENDVDLDYHSAYFLPGVLLTLLSVAGCVAVLVASKRGRQVKTLLTQ